MILPFQCRYKILQKIVKAVKLVMRLKIKVRLETVIDFSKGLRLVVIRVCATTDHLRIISPHLGENAVNE